MIRMARLTVVVALVLALGTVGYLTAQTVAPPCTPLRVRFSIDSSDAELSQGDIAYVAIRVTTPDGRFQGHVVIAGDQDVPLLAYLRPLNRAGAFAVVFCPEAPQ
jgi:hypothetical protein